jgi:4-azaleucine resistance transporter AzlC
MNRSDFWQGARDIAPMTGAYAPIATIWGAAAASHGFPVFQAWLMSFWVYSGTAQFVSLDLLKAGTPLVLLVVTVLTVSLRHVLMSASISRHIKSFPKTTASFLLFWLTDEAWAMLERRALERPLTPSYFFGAAFPIWPTWWGFSTLGAWLGNRLGDTSKFGLDFAFAAMFIAVLAGFWKGGKTALILVTSAATAVAAKYVMPESGWYIIIGGLAGMLMAVLFYKEEAHG